MRETVRLCGVDEIGAGEARRFDTHGYRVAVARVGGDFYAVGDRCSHANFSLSEGTVDTAQCQIECPKHSARFDLLTGAALCLPATVAVPVYELQVNGSDLLLVLPPEPDMAA